MQIAGNKPSNVSELLIYIKNTLRYDGYGKPKNNFIQANDNLNNIFNYLVEILGTSLTNPIKVVEYPTAKPSTGDSVGDLYLGVSTTEVWNGSTWSVFPVIDYTTDNSLTLSTDTFSINYARKGNVYTGNGESNSPLIKYTGTKVTGGTSTTCVPFMLFQPAGTSDSNGWSVFGTTIGMNESSGFIGHFLNFKVNNNDALAVDYTGGITSKGIIETLSVFRFYAKGNISSPSDGIFTFYNAGQSDFTRVNLGGVTSSFPAIARSGAKVQIRKADNSGYAALEVLDEAYGSGWDNSVEVPTKNAIYDKIQSLNLADSTYTPTFTNVVNTSLYTARLTNYYRVGSKVHVEGWCRFTITASLTLTQGRISLPIPANMNDVYNAAGYIVSYDGSQLFGTIAAYSASGYLDVVFDISNPLVNGAHEFTFGFTYKV